jgi:hypothetical protein
VDRDADEVEHVLEAGLVLELEAHLAALYPDLTRPPSVHDLRTVRSPDLKEPTAKETGIPRR